MGHTSEDTTISQLQSILSIARGLKETTASSHLLPHSRAVTNDSFAVGDSITLPVPPPLLPSLLAAGATHEVATAASRTYQLYAERLRQHIRQSVIVACREIAKLPRAPPVSLSDGSMKKIVSAATEVYLSRIRSWKDDVVQRIRESSATSTKVAARNSHAFNYEFVPLLEQFFQDNQFPTHADKMFLAKKSNMEYRQIHVWFQNRRSRTKKEGKPLRKKPVYEGMKPLGKQYQYIKGRVAAGFLAPEPSGVDSSDGANETEIAWNDMSKNTISSSSPLHAFPSPYPPPVCRYDPFPCKSGPVQFSKPEWRRVSREGPSPPHSTSIDELVDMFSQLNVRDEVRCKGSSKLPSHSATAAITVIPSRAPHPSLILCEYRQPANIVQHHPIVRAGVSSQKVFQSSCPVSKPATLIPSFSHDSNKLPSKRKTAPLPRRLPGRMRNTSRDTTPSESSSPSSASPCLFSPDFECRNCSFSSASSLSTPSDIASAQELPHSSGTR